MLRALLTSFQWHQHHHQQRLQHQLRLKRTPLSLSLSFYLYSSSDTTAIHINYFQYSNTTTNHYHHVPNSWIHLLPAKIQREARGSHHQRRKQTTPRHPAGNEAAEWTSQFGMGEDSGGWECCRLGYWYIITPVLGSMQIPLFFLFFYFF